MKYILKSITGKYFKEMTGLGPRNTDSDSDAQEFDSRENAARHPAMKNLLASYEVVSKDSKEE